MKKYYGLGFLVLLLVFLTPGCTLEDLLGLTKSPPIVDASLISITIDCGGMQSCSPGQSGTINIIPTSPFTTVTDVIITDETGKEIPISELEKNKLKHSIEVGQKTEMNFMAPYLELGPHNFNIKIIYAGGTESSLATFYLRQPTIGLEIGTEGLPYLKKDNELNFLKLCNHESFPVSNLTMKIYVPSEVEIKGSIMKKDILFEPSDDPYSVLYVARDFEITPLCQNPTFTEAIISLKKTYLGGNNYPISAKLYWSLNGKETLFAETNGTIYLKRS